MQSLFGETLPCVPASRGHGDVEDQEEVIRPIRDAVSKGGALATESHLVDQEPADGDVAERGDAGGEHHGDHIVLRLQESELALQKREGEDGRDHVTGIGPGFHCNGRILPQHPQNVARCRPDARQRHTHHQQHQHGALHVDSERVVLLRPV